MMILLDELKKMKKVGRGANNNNNNNNKRQLEYQVKNQILH